MDSNKIGKEVSLKPPNFFTASRMAYQIADNKQLPLFVQQKFQLVALALDTQIYAPIEISSPIARITVETIAAHNYGELEASLDKYAEHVKRLAENSNNGATISAGKKWLNRLKEIEDLKNNPNYTEYKKGEKVVFWWEFPASPMAVFP